MPCTSAPFLVIRYQLKIDHQATNVPTEWYKDQGGMHKHMALYVKLTDTEGKLVQPRHGIIHLILRFVPCIIQLTDRINLKWAAYLRMLHTDVYLSLMAGFCIAKKMVPLAP